MSTTREFQVTIFKLDGSEEKAVFTGTDEEFEKYQDNLFDTDNVAGIGFDNFKCELVNGKYAYVFKGEVPVDFDDDTCPGWEQAFEAYLGSDEFKIDTDNTDTFSERAHDYDN